MTLIPLMLAGLAKRHRTRTLLTTLSIIVAFVIFVYMATIKKAFDFGVSSVGDNRLWVRSKMSLLGSLPRGHEDQIGRLDGVTNVTHANFFAGIYKDPKNLFGQLSVEARGYLAMFPEFVLPKEQLDAWLRTRTGAVAGRRIADRFGWKVGDKIPLRTSMFPGKGGSVWTFDLVGIYDGKHKETDLNQFLFRSDYFQENFIGAAGRVGFLMVMVKDPRRADEIARAIDALFENSPDETKTDGEAAMRKGFTNQVANFGAIVGVILSAVFFTILLIAGNTMAQSVRERTSELAVMKAVGFTDLQVLMFVLSESFLIAWIGGSLGIAAGWGSVAAGDPTGVLPFFYFPLEKLPLALGFIIGLGLLAGLLPAIQAMRLNTVEALRRE
jgi:putative ABC transport system permease protein